jgi:hypothetical protein
MIGGLVVLVILAAAGTAIGLWVQQSRANQPAPKAQTPRGRSAVLAEVGAYIGATLILAGGTAAVAQEWSDLTEATRLTILAIVTLLFFVLGFVMRRSGEAAFRRVSAISWALSVAAFAGSVGAVNALLDTEAKTAFLSISAASAAYATALWWANKHAIQHALMFAGVLFTVSAAIVRAVHDPDAWMICVPLWVIALGWATLGWLRRIEPWWTAVSLGVVVALVAPANIEPAAAKYSIGIATAVTVMAAGVVLKFVPGLGLGAIGLFAYVVGAVVYYFRDTLGAPAALAIAGLLIVVIAAFVARALPFMRPLPRPSSPPFERPSWRRKPPTQTPPPPTPPSERHAA